MCLDTLVRTSIKTGNPSISTTECQIWSELGRVNTIADMLRP